MKSYFNDVVVVVVSVEIAAIAVVAVPFRCTKTNASLLRVSSQSISIFSIFLRFASTPSTSSSLWWFFICLALKKRFIGNQIGKLKKIQTNKKKRKIRMKPRGKRQLTEIYK